MESFVSTPNSTLLRIPDKKFSPTKSTPSCVPPHILSHLDSTFFHPSVLRIVKDVRFYRIVLDRTSTIPNLSNRSKASQQDRRIKKGYRYVHATHNIYSSRSMSRWSMVVFDSLPGSRQTFHSNSCQPFVMLAWRKQNDQHLCERNTFQLTHALLQ